MILGYASSTSVVQGRSIDFHLSLEPGDASPLGTTLTIQNVAETSIAATVAVRVSQQPIPTERPWEGFGWTRTVTFHVPSDWPSGLYRVFYDNDGTTANLMSFVVRPVTGHRTAPILVHVSYLTPAAYNPWGGKGFYHPANEDGSEPRARRVGMDRPSAQPVVAHLERPNDFVRDAGLLAWLKDEGFEADCCSSYDLHSEPAMLSRYKCLVLSYHDEYWTKEMRDNVERFVRAGGNMAVLSGNTSYRQVRFEDDGRTVVFYKYASLDPLAGTRPDETTVAFAEPPVNRPQNALLGVGFTHGAWSGPIRGEDRRGYRIRFPDHWVFDGVTARETSSFLHYETDAAGYAEEPEGYPRVTGEEGTPLNTTVLATADLRHWPGKPGRATMTLYSRHGTVFNAATTDWDDAIKTDPVVAQITRNIFRRLGGVTRWDWEMVGHANDPTAMTALEGKLFLTTEHDLLWRRFPVGADVPWKDIGHANNVISMTSSDGRLFCLTSDNHLWHRSPVEVEVNWQLMPVRPPSGTRAIAAAGGMLYAVDRDGALHRKAADDTTNPFRRMDGFERDDKIVTMTSYSDILFAATSENRLLRTNRDFIAESNRWTDIHHCFFAKGLAMVDWMLYVATSENRLWRIDLFSLDRP